MSFDSYQFRRSDVYAMAEIAARLMCEDDQLHVDVAAEQALTILNACVDAIDQHTETDDD